MAAPVCISVINMKGGVGKTTIAALLSRYAARDLNRSVLAVDLDPQANLSQALMGAQAYKRFLDDKDPSIVEVFAGYQPPIGSAGASSSLELSNVVRPMAARNLQLIPSRFDFSDSLIGALQPDPRILARLIADNFQNQDLIFIDCAPTESVLTRAAYYASRYILVPVRPEFLATIGFPLLQDSLDDFRSRNRGHQIDIIGVVVNNATYGGGPEKTNAMAEIRSVCRENGWPLFNRQLAYSKGFPKIMRGNYTWLGKSIGTFANFADEFFSRPELSHFLNQDNSGGK